MDTDSWAELPTPKATDSEADTVKLPRPTVNGIDVVADCVPELPVTIKVLFPNAVAVLAVSVMEAVPVVGFGEIAAVTPLGSPATARFTLPVNPYNAFTERGIVDELPGAMLTGPLPLKVNVGTKTSSVMLAVACRDPDVPVTVTALVLVAAVLLAVSVSVLFPGVGFGVSDAVTPLGSPAIARLTAPANPYIGFT